MQTAIAELGHARGNVARSHDILRSGAIRLHEAALLDVEIEDGYVGTAKNGTYVPANILADEAFWRVVGLYIAEGHVSTEVSGRQRLFWSFHPTDEHELVEEVAGFWRARGVKATIRRGSTATSVGVSSRLLGTWWTEILGLGVNSYAQRLPDLIWDEPEVHKRAVLAGMWLGDGSWSYQGGGPSVVLEYGTVSRELADGMLRLLGELGIVARLKVGRTTKSTSDTYWLDRLWGRPSRATARPRSRADREAIVRVARAQAKRIAPTGYRRIEKGAAWVRVDRS